MDPMVIASAAGAWAWGTYGKELIEKSKTLAGGRWERFQDAREWQRAAKTYRDNLRQNVATIRVLGKSNPVPLEGVFTDVYILDQVTGRLRYDPAKLREQDVKAFDRFDRYLHRGRQERIGGLEMVQRGDNLFILGKPGAGKTTFMKYIALQALNSADGATLAEQTPLDCVPIFVSLKEWSMAGMDELLPFLVQQFDQCNFPDAQPFV